MEVSPGLARVVARVAVDATFTPAVEQVQEVLGARGEAQGGIDSAGMRVGVCVQDDTTCPVTNMAEPVVTDEGITVTVTVPFTAITPLVHIGVISGAVSGRTFRFAAAYVPVASTAIPSSTPTAIPSSTPTASATATTIPVPTATPPAVATRTPTPGGATATAAPTSTATPASTSTATPVATVAPTPTSVSPPHITALSLAYSANSQKATISWTTDQQTSINTVYVFYNAAWRPYCQCATGFNASVAFVSNGTTTAPDYLPAGSYSYYVESATSAPTDAPTSSSAGAVTCASPSGYCGTLTLK